MLKITTVLYLAVNAVLTLTNQVGVYDQAILLANISCIAVFAHLMVREHKMKN